jgi:DNA uptake protein ComE-like DNA-binding protein
MIKPIILALSFSLLLPFGTALAQKAEKTKTAVKEAVTKTKEAAKDATEKVKDKAKEALAEKKPAKKEELSESDKALQDSAAKMAAKLTPTQNAKLLKALNSGDSSTLQEIDGLGEAKAGNVIKKRPYAKVEDVIMVDGIGEATFGNMVAWAKGDQKAAPAAAETKPASKEMKKAPEAEPKKPAAPGKKKAA